VRSLKKLGKEEKKQRARMIYGSLLEEEVEEENFNGGGLETLQGSPTKSLSKFFSKKN